MVSVLKPVPDATSAGIAIEASTTGGQAICISAGAPVIAAIGTLAPNAVTCEPFISPHVQTSAPCTLAHEPWTTCVFGEQAASTSAANARDEGIRMDLLRMGWGDDHKRRAR